ncbi:histidine phosphatase family protein [Vagococcus intermedius]|uniref:Histidine phosphatase family protein n=1 Tax=Vagococcus intermedius TaxID=2991418 RepID=A0AAF0CW52_9ENTE|nr:histidine phosphatase family protein [Vagococcus intermedius]WEG73976.1 histidine phosphatase family protein [Vagococcus intermedius]WEG76056.1 histidine phosphatase family protein [Vagococcus intermedius]
MKKVKKIGLLISVVAMSVLTLTACGKNEDTSDEKAQGSEPVTIYLTRHGETLFNLTSKVQGWSDTPLTEKGEEVADALGKGLKAEKITFDSAYSSDLKRAYDTASHVLANTGQKDLKVTYDEGLREASYGSFEGDRIAESSVKLAEKNGYKDGEEFEAKTGKMYWNELANTYKELDEIGIAEDSKMIIDRMTKTLEKIGKTESEAGNKNVLVVSHGMAINVMLSSLSDQYEGKPLKNVSVTKIIYDNGKLKVETIGDNHYFEEGLKL